MVEPEVRPEGERAVAAWSLAARATGAYALAQALLLGVGVVQGVPWDAVVLRLVVVGAVVGAVGLGVHRRSLGSLQGAACLLGAGALTALVFQHLGLAPRGLLPAITLGTGVAWGVALGVAAMRIGRDRRG